VVENVGGRRCALVGGAGIPLRDKGRDRRKVVGHCAGASPLPHFPRPARRQPELARKTRLTTASLAASPACSQLPDQTLGLTSSSLAQHNSGEASVCSRREPLRDTGKSPPPVPRLLDFPCRRKSVSCLSQSPPYQNDYVPAPSVHKSRADHD
jgi:hypothetical protein